MAGEGAGERESLVEAIVLLEVWVGTASVPHCTCLRVSEQRNKRGGGEIGTSGKMGRVDLLLWPCSMSLIFLNDQE